MRTGLKIGTLLALSAALMVGRRTDEQDWGGDFAGYIMQAEALVHGTTAEFLQQNAFTISQSSVAFAPIAYPWGYPLLLAPVYAFCGFRLLAFKTVGLVCYLLFLLTLWLAGRKVFDPPEQWLLLGLFAFNPALLRAGDDILSDLPFLFFSTVSLALMARRSAAARFGIEIIWSGTLGLAMGAAVLVRANGVLLPLVYGGMAAAGVGIFRAGSRTPSFSRGRWVPLALPLAVALGLAMGAMVAWPAMPASYLNQLRDLSPASIASNLWYYSFALADFFAPGQRFRLVGAVIYLLTLPLAWCGVRRYYRESMPLLAYGAMTVVLYIIWPYQQGLRFWFPLLPVYATFLLLGLGHLRREGKLPGAAARLLLTGVVLMFFAASVYSVLVNVAGRRNRATGPASAAAAQMFAYIRENTAHDAVVVFRKPRVMRLYTGRASVLCTEPSGGKWFDVWVLDKREEGGQLSRAQWLALVARHPARLVFENDGFRVYRFRPQAEVSAPPYDRGAHEPSGRGGPPRAGPCETRKGDQGPG